MTISDIFQKISEHQITGMMMHQQLSMYFDFLNLHGYKRQQEYHYLDESIEHIGINRYFINHHNMLIPMPSAHNPKMIPDSWYRYNRQDVSASDKRNAIKTAFEKWHEWEAETKELYAESYKELCDIGEVAAAMKVKNLLTAVDQELKCVDREHIKLESINYDLTSIYLEQDEIHEKYKEMEKTLGVDIC